MKFKSVLIATSLSLTVLSNLSEAVATEIPLVESFTFSPSEIDVLGTDTTLKFELKVSHPFGIENPSSFITIKDSVGNTWGLSIFRTDTPVNTALEKVTYQGSLALPRTISAGVYTVSASEIRNNKMAGYSYSTGEIFAKKIRELSEAENSLLIRSGGDLNYVYKTFQGPSFDSSLSIIYKNINKYNSSNKPIWKVGETFSPLDFYEPKVSSLELKIKSSTPLTCSSDGKILKLNSVGNCDFTVFTSKTKDFAIFEDKQTVLITNPRIKSSLFIPKIENQTTKNLPKIVNLPQVYSAAEGYVLAKTITPTVCVPSGFTVRLIAGGTCVLTYQTSANSTYLASDLYEQNFEIIRDPQTVSFVLPNNVDISSKSLVLNSTASGGGVITYATSSTGVCSITGSTLNLLKAGNCSVTATQAGTSTLAPASATASITLTGTAVGAKKTITCVKGKTTKKVTGTNPKCPTGYKLKK
jgi:hypothetical protein